MRSIMCAGISRAVLYAGLLLCPGLTFAGSDKLLEFQVGDKTYRGKVSLLGPTYCWLLDREGRLTQFRLRDIKNFHRVDSKFRPYRAAEMRDRLRREFGRDYDVAGSEHYLVCAPRGRAKQYAAVFEDLYRTFCVYFGAHGFRLAKPEFPLVAVVFPDRQQFIAYQKTDSVPVSRLLLGYYQPKSNRVALFESATSRISATRQSGESLPVAAQSLMFARPHQTSSNLWMPQVAEPTGWLGSERSLRSAAPSVTMSGGSLRSTPATLRRNSWFGTIQAGLRDTMIHEATHQAAFNTGLHSRIGDNPHWIVEGLATVFEAPGIRQRNTTSRASPMSRVNRGRFVRFRNYMQHRRKAKSLKSFIADDTLYRRAKLDFYAQAWALSFYLLETRSSQYAGYLKQIAARDPLKPYTSKQRVADFQSAFGDDLNSLETGFLRYMERLK